MDAWLVQERERGACVHLRMSFLMGPTSTSIGHSGLVAAWHPVLTDQMASAMNGTT
jgi:hypothetical protein